MNTIHGIQAAGRPSHVQIFSIKICGRSKKMVSGKHGCFSEKLRRAAFCHPLSLKRYGDSPQFSPTIMYLLRIASRLTQVFLMPVTGRMIQPAGMQIQRASHHTGAEFADFMTRTRRDLTVINSTSPGNTLLSGIAAEMRADSSKMVKIADADPEPSRAESPNPRVLAPQGKFGEEVRPNDMSKVSRSAFSFIGPGE